MNLGTWRNDTKYKVTASLHKHTDELRSLVHRVYLDLQYVERTQLHIVLLLHIFKRVIIKQPSKLVFSA